MITKVNIGTDRLEKIFHVSDVHIRNFKRHQEYNRVFERLNEYLSSNLTPNGVVMVTGDIVHSKTDVTPELFQEVQNFLKNLSTHYHVLVTAGNHDANLNNSHRLDTLSPIINAIDSDRIHYLKDNGVYQIADKHLSVWSVFEEPQNYVRANDFESDYKIATFHGGVANAVTEVGFQLSHETIKVSDFHGFDVVLLGDIHKRQFLNSSRTIAYPGSLIQQNHAESLSHGILVWDLESRSAEYVNIPNDTGFFTIDVENGVYKELPNDLPKRLYLRVRYKNTSQSELKNLVAEVKSKYEIVETSLQRINESEHSSIEARKLNVLDTREVDYQNSIISSHLKDKYQLDEEDLKAVCDINRALNHTLDKKEKSWNVMWVPKKFEFENMFSYGKGNVIDFTNMQGTYGIFAANASGKSTFLDSLTFCVFDKCSKTSKGSQVMNNASNNFYCKLTFELNELEYFIERKAIRQKNGNVRVDVDFWYTDEFGNKVSLNGKERNDTNANIRNLLGTYEDFILTALSVQNNNTGFIDMNQKDRKDLLSQFLDINVFEELYNVANNDMKEVYVLLKNHQKQNYFDLFNQVESKSNELDSELKKAKKEKEIKEKKRSQINDEIIKKTSELQKIDQTIVDMDDLKNKKSSVENNLQSLKNQLQETKTQLEDKIEKVKEVKKLVDSANIEEIDSGLKALDDHKRNHTKIIVSLKETEVELISKKDKLEKLKDLKYDPNCNFCMENVFVKDAIQTSSSFCESSKLYDQKVYKLNEANTQLSSSIHYLDLKKTYDTNKSSLHELQSSTHTLSSTVYKIQSKIKENESYLIELENKIQAHNDQQEAIIFNESIQKDIKEYKQNALTLEEGIREINETILEFSSEKKVCESKMGSYRDSINQLKELEDKYKYYEYYLGAVHRDGVPHRIISTVIPKIEEEINNILNQLVDFSIILQTDDKNINAYIAYDENRYWPIELTSGMEKFIASLAIRTSLINISTLPRPNFLAIDEGFGALDQQNLGSIAMFFDYLKTQFRFITVISHIESMRDIVDHHLEVNKVNGRSSITHMG